MRIKKGFDIMTICGLDVIVCHGLQNKDFSKIINLNESGAYLWRAVEGRDFDAAELARLLLAEYEVAEDVAMSDASLTIEQWQSAGLIE